MRRVGVVILHCLYWACYALLLLLLVSLLVRGFMPKAIVAQGTATSVFSAHTEHFVWFFAWITIVPAVLAFYISNTVLASWYMRHRSFVALVMAGVAVYVAIGCVSVSAIQFMFGIALYKEAGLRAMLEASSIFSLLAGVHGVLGFVLRGFVQWFDEAQRSAVLHQQQFETELALLKAQIDPHFLFNTLNNIDILIEHDHVRASSYLQTLSSFLRYVLYDTKVQTITLEQEIHSIEQYIALQKIRTANTDFVEWSVQGGFGAWCIAPLIFMPFIENAFKYADPKKAETAIVIKIDIQTDRCIFECTNSYRADGILQSKVQSGLGSTLIKRRLVLLYPNRHTLKITDLNNEYHVQLIVDRETI